jgi:dihydrofolate reductase
VHGKIIITQYISLDGVIEDPVGMEGSGLGDWTGPFSRGPAGDEFKEDELRDAQAMIFGRKTYDGFAAVWPTVAGEYAARMNTLPKYLASRTIAKPEWANTTLLGEDFVAAVTRIKEKTAGNILVFGSGSICHQLLANDLVDELSLIIYPVMLGKGIRLFPEGHKTTFELVENVAFNDGLMLLRYRLASR